ncbi:hypothetical protein H8E88_27610 [candidate division KSB1 bacterium]|nr:hypothetical protein [candidate division KSB1 bacterium]MBL7095800.1 hypothetical protein [candidate division KSB1 bacterium]
MSKKVLIVEDDYIIALGLESDFQFTCAVTLLFLIETSAGADAKVFSNPDQLTLTTKRLRRRLRRSKI